MSNYIEVEPIIEEMQNLINDAAYNYPYATTSELEALRGKYEAVIDYIKEQPIADVQPVDRWISIDEQLPNVSEGKVLCSTLTEISALTLWCKQGVDTVEWTFISGIPYSGKVLYWLPLPQIPVDIWQE